jgi:hypothetical protein
MRLGPPSSDKHHAPHSWGGWWYGQALEVLRGRTTKPGPWEAVLYLNAFDCRMDFGAEHAVSTG